MSNMSYCRWQNTAEDLEDAVYDFENFLKERKGETSIEDYRESLSDFEKSSFDKILILARRLSKRTGNYFKEY